MNSIIESEPQPLLNLDHVLDACYSLKRNRILSSDDLPQILFPSPEAAKIFRDAMRRYAERSVRQWEPHAHPFKGAELALLLEKP